LLAGHRAQITALAVSEDGGIVTGAVDATIRRWLADADPQEHRVAAPVVALACSAASLCVAVALQDGTTRLLDSSGADLVLAEGVEVESLAFSPDGALLATGAKDNTNRLFDVRARGAAGALRGHADGLVNGVADASGRYLPLVCTLNAAKVTDTFARLLGVDRTPASPNAMRGWPAGPARTSLNPRTHPSTGEGARDQMTAQPDRPRCRRRWRRCSRPTPGSPGRCALPCPPRCAPARTVSLPRR
jgi:hypothetical protein